MICLFWNCRGTGSKSLPGLIKEIRKRYAIDFLALFETKCSGSQAHSCCQKLGFDSHHVMDANGRSGGSEEFFVTSIYASTNKIKRRQLWDELKHLKPRNDIPWFLGGDFNATLFLNERRSTATNPTCVDKDFMRWYEDLELNDLGCNGPLYTWKREGCESHLDRIVANNPFKETYIDASVKHLPWFNSDHRPVLFTTSVFHSHKKTGATIQICGVLGPL
ncbi:uncharacterized protein LOC114740215 [Neltuma alba]|uniref:uncharacterized protein LOC114740215 n=1 Tax=Neltuma alba TaxID=207710 RepID=UPI0010A3AA34|nr:uncharacterized protein LOC114740215 [Prosopis alba]